MNKTGTGETETKRNSSGWNASSDRRRNAQGRTQNNRRQAFAESDADTAKPQWIIKYTKPRGVKPTSEWGFAEGENTRGEVANESFTKFPGVHQPGAINTFNDHTYKEIHRIENVSQKDECI